MITREEAYEIARKDVSKNVGFLVLDVFFFAVFLLFTLVDVLSGGADGWTILSVALMGWYGYDGTHRYRQVVKWFTDPNG